MTKQIVKTFTATDSTGKVWTIHEFAIMQDGLFACRGNLAGERRQVGTEYQTDEGYRVNPIGNGCHTIVPLSLEVKAEC